MRFRNYGLNRYLCSVLDDMRKVCSKIPHLNVRLLESLIEEAQVLGNRMESALEDHGDHEDLREDIKNKHNQLKGLAQEIKDIEEHIIELKLARDSFSRKPKSGVGRVIK